MQASIELSQKSPPSVPSLQGPPSPGWAVDGIKNWTKSPIIDFSSAWQGVLNFITDNVTMPDVDVVGVYRTKTYARYQAPHVQNQEMCHQLVSDFYADPLRHQQPMFGCNASCTRGCVYRQPSLHNPGPSFANDTHSVTLVRLHKATVHFTCVRALLVLKRLRLDNNTIHLKERHMYALARVLMKPAPGHAHQSKLHFRNNIVEGNYAKNSTGFWREWQTGTTGLRSMDVSFAHPEPSPAVLKFTGVTEDRFRKMTGQRDCWIC